MEAKGGSRQIAIVTAGNLSSPVVALATAPLLAHGLGAVGRGEVAAATAPLMLCVAGLTLGLPEAITYFTAKISKLRAGSFVRALALATIAGALGTLGIFFLAPLLADHDNELTALIRLAAVALVPALITGCFRGLARGYHRWSFVVGEQLVSAAVKLVAIAGMFMGGTLTPLTASLVLSVSTFVGLVPYLFIIGSLNSDASRVGSRDFLKFGVAVWPGAVAGVLLSKIDQTLILPLSTAAALGVYAIAVSLSDVARVFNSAVRDVIFARESAANNDVGLATASRLSTLITSALAIAVTIGTYFLAVPMFGEEFSGAPLLVGILLLGIVLGNPGSVVAAGLAARGKAMLRSLAICAGLVINIVLIYVLVPPMGAVGAAVAAAVANAITGVLVLLFARKASTLKLPDVLVYKQGDVALLVDAIKKLIRGRIR